MQGVYSARVNLQRRERPLVIGHRGAPVDAPGNSREGLAAAIAAGADIVEFDLGARLLLGHPGEAVPQPPLSLEGALAYLAPHPIGIQIDLKRPGIEREVVRTVAASGLCERVIVSSTWGRSLRRLQREAPRLTRVIGYPRDRVGAARLPWPSPVERASAAALGALMPLRAARLLERGAPAALALHHALVSPAAVALVHARGAALIAWTVNEPARVARLSELGVDAIVSDDPRMALAVLATLGGL
jgi:glycerophosphoryl diester phosphodiesterase